MIARIGDLHFGLSALCLKKVVMDRHANVRCKSGIELIDSNETLATWRFDRRPVN
jgi:hypothetical protein